MKEQNAHITPRVLLWKTNQWKCTSLVSFIPNTVVVRTSTGSQLCSTVNLFYARHTNIWSYFTVIYLYDKRLHKVKSA